MICLRLLSIIHLKEKLVVKILLQLFARRKRENVKRGKEKMNNTIE